MPGLMARLSVAALAIALLLGSCASSTDVIDSRFLGCEPGQDISIMAGLNAPNLTDGATESRFMILVDISNNSHDEVTVKSIRVEQSSNQAARYVFDTGYGKYDQVIEGGKDHTFEIPVMGRIVQGVRDVRGSGQGIDFAVSVFLTNGDQYRCSFSMDPSR